MTESKIPPSFYPDLRTLALFDSERPRPQFLLESERLQGLVAGLEAGQQIPVHPEALAVYYFMAGEGVMTVDETEFGVQAGAAVITPQGAARGLRATSRLVFLAVKAGG